MLASAARTTLSRDQSWSQNSGQAVLISLQNKRDADSIPCGALAQLGERLICIQEVIGSIPIGSTKFLCNLVSARKRFAVQGACVTRFKTWDRFRHKVWVGSSGG